MAIVKGNIITKGFSGQLGGQLVFRQVSGETIVTTKSVTDKDPTEAQLKQRTRFKQAMVFATAQMGNPQMQPLYEAAAKRKGMNNPQNLAVQDYFEAPTITDVDTSAYQGKAGDKIQIEAVDNFMVDKVTVEILNQDGTAVEAGQAVQQGDGSVWVYTTTMANDSLSGDRIIVKAIDLPGNITSQEKAL